MAANLTYKLALPRTEGQVLRSRQVDELAAQMLRSFARRFFGQWLSVDAAPLTLVFDDCHRLSEGSPLFELIDAAREVAGDQLRFLLISRRPPAVPLSHGAVPGWLAVYDDLGLSLDEAAAVAQGVSGRVWSAAEAEGLRVAQGWMAHVLALARHPGAAGVAVSEFLGEELLTLLPPDERRGLRLAAELPELPRSLAQITQAQARLLDQLAGSRYFVDQTANDSWRMHDLLRDALRRRTRALESPADLAQARRERAAWVRATAPEVAMNLLVAADDEPAALALLADAGRAWLAQGRHRQLQAWLGGFTALAGPLRVRFSSAAAPRSSPPVRRMRLTEPGAARRRAMSCSGARCRAWPNWSMSLKRSKRSKRRWACRPVNGASAAPPMR